MSLELKEKICDVNQELLNKIGKQEGISQGKEDVSKR